MDDLLQEFLIEARDNAALIERDALRLEKEPSNRATVDALFRAAHTVKGSSGFMGMKRVQAAARQAEDLLAACRDGHAPVTAALVSGLLDAADRIRRLCEVIEKTGTEPDGDDADIAADAEKTMRIDVGLLDRMMTLSGELVLARNQLLRRAGDTAEALLVSRLVSQLQDAAAAARLQPVAVAWQGLPRLARDTAAAEGKQVRIETTGGDTALDRHILRALQGPLTHMVRNAVSHGIERPDARQAAQKPAEGVIGLSARQAAGHVVITVSDDGAGIDLARVAARAGRTTVDIADAQDLIFSPGFSTAGQLSDVSGRGVGLDAVRDVLRRIGGTVDVFSSPGRGTTFTLRLPLTLAVMQAMTFESGGQAFAVTRACVREVARLAEVETVDGRDYLPLRGRMIPVVSLSQLAGADICGTRPGRALILETERALFALSVDRVLGHDELLVKPLPQVLARADVLAGAAVMGDGRVAVLLGHEGIARAAGVTNQLAAAPPAVPRAAPRQKALLFSAGGDLHALALPAVRRIETPAAGEVTQDAGGRYYLARGAAPLPLHMPASRPPHSGGRVIVLEGSRAGILADAVLDIAALAGSEQPLHGQAVMIEDRLVTWWDAPLASVKHETAPRRVLVVDDSRFFRDLLLPLLADAGYAVESVTDAATALKLRDAGEAFDVILSDVEMPGMDGIEFASRVRAAESTWRDVPMVALSAHATPFDIQKARAAGFDDFITKFDRDSLTRSIRRLEARAA